MIALEGSNLTYMTNQIKDLICSYRLYNKRGTKNYVYNVPISFDTETTSYTKEDGSKVAWCYIWMFRFGDPLKKDSISVYGRTLNLLDLFLTTLSDKLSLRTGDSSRLVYVYVHNLGFDFEQIREKLNIIDQLNNETHSPIYLLDKRGFEFRDSVILSGGLSLKKIGQNLNNGIVKKSGDLDYSLIRTPETPLTEKELGYCSGDIDVLASYIQTQINQFKRITSIPLTNTGRVRNYARDCIFKTHSYGSYLRYRGLMDKLTLSPEEYNQCQRAFYGGFTHANIKYVNQTLKNVLSYDFTSSYPAVMLSKMFPMSTPEHVDNMSFDDLRKIINDATKLCIFDLEMSNVFIKDDVGDCYLSNDPNKTHVLNPVVNNGRIVSCDKFAMTCTSIDFMIINQCYTWDKIHVSNVMIWHKIDYLPTPLMGVVLDLYKAKTTLKGVKGKEEEYQVKKGMLNSLYGMCVTRILRDNIQVDENGWIKTPLTDEEKEKNIKTNNQSKRRFLYYPWGVFITAYARMNLWTAIKTLGDDYIYSDTDSIKVFESSTKIKQYLEDYHHDLTLDFAWMLDKRRKFSWDDLKPKTVKGIEKPIGVWDYEGKYQYFKTLGAKRYLKYDGKLVYNDGSKLLVENEIESTVAGVSPYAMSKHLTLSVPRVMESYEEYCKIHKEELENDEEPKDPFGEFSKIMTLKEPEVMEMFDNFKDGLYIPKGKTGKLISTYCIDIDVNVTDCKGKKYHVKQKYSVNLSDSDFTLTLSGSFKDLINKMYAKVKNDKGNI